MKRSQIISSFLLLVFLIVIVVCSVFIYTEEKEIQESVNVVDQVKAQVVEESAEITSETELYTEESNTEEVTSVTNKGGSQDSGSSGSYLYRKINFEKLQAINPDATRWVYIPNTNIDYYVMQEQTEGETYYLWRNIYKKKSSWGSILTPKVPEDIEDAHLLLFGHRMSNKSVAFGRLNKYAKQSYGKSHSDVYVYYPDRAERWKLWAVCKSNAEDMIYQIPYTLGSDSYQTLIDHVDATKLYSLCDKPDNQTKTLVLSTCNGRRSGSSARFYIVCVLDEMYIY